MPIIRRSDCFPLPIVVCPVVAVVMLESRLARCVHCVENVACLRQWNAVGSPDDGHKDARNMLRYYWLPINHYLLHLVGFSFTYVPKETCAISYLEKSSPVKGQNNNSTRQKYVCTVSLCHTWLCNYVTCDVSTHFDNEILHSKQMIKFGTWFVVCAVIFNTN